MKLETVELLRKQVDNGAIFGLEECKGLDFEFVVRDKAIVAISSYGDRITITPDKKEEYLQMYKAEVKLYDKELTSCSYMLIDVEDLRVIDTKPFYILGDVTKAYDRILTLLNDYNGFEHLEDTADDLEQDAIGIALSALEETKNIKDFVLILEFLLGIEIMEMIIYLLWDSLAEIIDDWNDILADDIIDLRNEERVN